MLTFTLLVLSALPAPTQLPDWLAGHWLQCTPNGELSETWTDARGEILLGVSKTIGPRRVSWELSRIARSGSGISFFASPSGQQPTEFHAVQTGDQSITFENTGHDFPQRILYRREGNRLIARIEGRVAGKNRWSEWTYDASPLNTVCRR